MATFNFSWHTPNTTGNVNYKVLYRLMGTSIWTSYLTSGTSTAIGPVLNNSIYDIEVQNINNSDNAVSTIVNAIGFTDPNPIISVTNASVAFSFSNLSSYITSYTCTIALTATPGTIIDSVEIAPTTTISHTFTGLSPTTSYVLSITPVASEFSHTFVYTAITSEFATCATPTLSSSYITSGTAAAPPVLYLTWQDVAIYPSCGYQVSYRTKGSSSYLTLTTSGTTSGTTTISTLVTAPASYEGYIQSNCCSSNLSGNLPFGANGYQPITVSVSVVNNVAYQVHVASAFGSPYDTLVSGTFNSINASGTTSIPYSVTYPANADTAVLNVLGYTPAGNPTVQALTVNLSPVFDNGGSLQQFNNSLTPSYFKFYFTSGTTWNGSPTVLPSFTLDRFTVTETDISGNVLAGDINISWIYDQIYGTGVIPYNTLTLRVVDPGNNNVMGSATVSTAVLGAINTTVSITKQLTAITTSNSFNIQALWSNLSVINTVPFYLPLF